MSGRFSAVGGMASAILSIGGLVVVVVKWAQSSEDQIGPILFSGAALFATFLILLFGVWNLGMTFRPSATDRSGRLIFAGDILMGGGLLLFALLNDAVPTLLEGRYEDNKDAVEITGFIAMGGVAFGLIAGGLFYIGKRTQPDWAPRGKQLCPDCAEYPKATANVCRYCGHRFHPLTAPTYERVEIPVEDA
jgi:hypothetical protein